MISYNADFYLGVHEYIHKLVGDRNISLRLVNVFTRADVPLQTFITAAKLYLKILNRARAESENMNLKKEFSKNIKSKRHCHSSSRSQYVGKMSTQLISHPYVTFISCCVISSKYYKDIAFNNESWGGISYLDKEEINKFERDTLGVLDYKINTAGDSNVMYEVEKILKKSGFPSFENSQKSFDFRNIMSKIFCFG